ncbi:MAG TPA: hypothetical protein VN040_05830 [Pseudosphingobacterium sp.]|nr:hypothetical protein [Pseudosphingobacterium sp.]
MSSIVGKVTVYYIYIGSAISANTSVGEIVWGESGVSRIVRK